MTTISESFNTADSTTLGPDLTWVEDVGDLQVVSNRARPASGTATLARADTTLSGNDAYAEIVAYSPASTAYGVGPICRKAASATQTYYLAWLVNTSGGQGTLYKVVGGAFTALGTTGVAAPFTDGDTVRIEADGTTIRFKINGVEIFSRTDSSIDGTTVGGKAAGLRFYKASSFTPEADSFAAGDLGGGGPTPVTATFSVSAAIQAARTAAASVNAAIQSSSTASASANAAISQARTVQAALDAAILQARSASASADAYVQAGSTVTASADAAISLARTGNATVDAAISRALTATAGLSAAVLEQLTASASVGAYVQAGTTAGASVNAAIQAQQSAAASVSAAIGVARSASLSLGAVIALQMSLGAAADAAVVAGMSASLSVGAYILSDDIPPVLGSLVGSTQKSGIGRPASLSAIARTSRQTIRR